MGDVYLLNEIKYIYGVEKEIQWEDWKWMLKCGGKEKYWSLVGRIVQRVEYGYVFMFGLIWELIKVW